DPIEIAAAYLFYLCRNHAFIDGNKRTALAACLVFLESNDLLPSTKLSTDKWEAFIVDLAASRLDRDQTTARLRKLLKQQRKPRRVFVSGAVNDSSKILRLPSSAREDNDCMLSAGSL